MKVEKHLRISQFREKLRKLWLTQNDGFLTKKKPVIIQHWKTCERWLTNILDPRKLTFTGHQLRNDTHWKDIVIKLGLSKETARKTKDKTK